MAFSATVELYKPETIGSENKCNIYYCQNVIVRFQKIKVLHL